MCTIGIHMGNSQFIKRNIYRSASLNAYVNELVKDHSLGTGIHSETIWNTSNYVADVTALNLERFDEDVIKKILNYSKRKYPMFSISGAATSLDQLKRWNADGIFDELDKVFNGNDSQLCKYKYTITCGNLRLTVPTENNVFKQ